MDHSNRVGTLGGGIRVPDLRKVGVVQVRMKVHVSGTRDGKEWPQRGSVMEMPDDEAMAYIDAGMAEAVATFPTPVETAVAPDVVEKRGPKPAAVTAPGIKKSDIGF